MTKLSQISFLLGAGFSAPDGYPTRNELNKLLSSIKQSDFLLHTDGTPIFLNGESDPNASWMNVAQRYFVEDFLHFYQKEILTPDDLFDYEVFIDYYKGLQREGFSCSKFNQFAADFKEKHNLTVTLRPQASCKLF